MIRRQRQYVVLLIAMMGRRGRLRQAEDGDGGGLEEGSGVVVVLSCCRLRDLEGIGMADNPSLR
jgi:hypothetical protein